MPQQDELVGVLNGKQLLAIVASFHADWRRESIDRLVAEWSPAALAHQRARFGLKSIESAAS